MKLHQKQFSNYLEGVGESKNRSYIVYMTEIIKHTLGLCGEHFHPNVWTLLLGGVGLSTISSYIRSYIKCKIKQALAYTQNTWQQINK